MHVDDNTVVGVGVMGGLVCCLLLVLAIGCTGRLCALRMGINRAQQATRSSAPLTLLQRCLLERELPPSYFAALTHPTHMGYESGVTQEWQEQRAALDPSLTHPLPDPTLSPHYRDPHLSRSEHSGREKEREERARLDNLFPAPPQIPESQTAYESEDVPLISTLELGEEAANDVPFLLVDSSDEEEGGACVPLAVDGEECSTTEGNNMAEENDSAEGHSCKEERQM